MFYMKDMGWVSHFPLDLPENRLLINKLEGLIIACSYHLYGRVHKTSQFSFSLTVRLPYQADIPYQNVGESVSLWPVEE